MAESSEPLNQIPTIGVLCIDINSKLQEHYGPKFYSYIAASYVKFLETSGAHVVPIWIPRTYMLSLTLTFFLGTTRGKIHNHIPFAFLFAVVLCALFAAAAANPGLLAYNAPLAYSTPLAYSSLPAAAPLAYTAAYTSAYAPYVAPYASSYSAHSVAHSAAFPAVYAAAPVATILKK